jgi:hypothetical protein
MTKTTEVSINVDQLNVGRTDVFEHAWALVRKELKDPILVNSMFKDNNLILVFAGEKI